MDRKALEDQRAAIRSDGEHWFVWGAFEELWLHCHLERSRPNADPPNDRVRKAYFHLSALQTRVTDVRTVVLKLEWMKGLRDSGDLEPMTWMFFASSDVVSFVSTVRSAMDHLAKALAVTAPKPGGIPHSFSDLQKWLAKDPTRAADLGGAGATAVSDATWFPFLKDLRDKLIHRSTQTLVFPGDGGISFQIFEGIDRLIDDPALMVSDNVVSFERLAAATTARLHQVTDSASAAMGSELGYAPDDPTGQSSHGGLRVIRTWTDQLLAEV